MGRQQQHTTERMTIKTTMPIAMTTTFTIASNASSASMSKSSSSKGSSPLKKSSRSKFRSGVAAVQTTRGANRKQGNPIIFVGKGYPPFYIGLFKAGASLVEVNQAIK